MTTNEGHAFYLNQKRQYMSKLDKDLKAVRHVLTSIYDADFAGMIIRETRQAYEDLIPKFPYVGGQDQPLMTKKIVEGAQHLALYQAMKKHDTPMEEIGKVIFDTVEYRATTFPHNILHRINGFLMFTRFGRNLHKKYAASTQQQYFAEGGLLEYVEGDGVTFDWGLNYLECPTLKFYRAQGADELTPWVCFTDFPFSKANRSGLERTMILATGGAKCDLRWKRGRDTLYSWPHIK